MSIKSRTFMKLEILLSIHKYAQIKEATIHIYSQEQLQLYTGAVCKCWPTGMY